jgi:competence protein ComEA
MSERVAEPSIAWYRLTRGEIAVIGILCLFWVVLCISLTASERSFADPLPRSTELPPARIDVNRASAAELTALPGIGERKADRIVRARHERSIRNLSDLSSAAGGIPQAALERMQPFVSFGNEP